METALITGATGFIGSWLVEKLLHEGTSVTAVIIEGEEERLESHIKNAIKIICHKPGEIFEARGLVKGVDVFYNLGWGGVAPEYKNDLELQMANIRFATDAVRFAANIGCKRFVGIGSAAEYVYYEGLIKADTPPSPADLYGAAKISARFMSQQLADLLGLGFVWAIPSSIFGPRRNDNNIISYTIRTLLGGKHPSYTKLEQMWDFLYVQDLIHALYLIGKSGVDRKVYGIGSGTHRPLHEYIEKIRDIIDPSLSLGIGDRPYPHGIIPSSCVDICDLVEDTGFKPAVSFDEGIKNTIRHFERKIK